MEQGRDNRRGRADGPRHILKPGKVDLLFLIHPVHKVDLLSPSSDAGRQSLFITILFRTAQFRG